MKTKNTTLADIANELDIDISTVSKALNDHPKISSKTKEVVDETARKLEYRRNHIATALVNGTSKLVGVMVPHTDEKFFAGALRGIEEAAKKAGYRIIIVQSHDKAEDEKHNLELMLEAQVDGVLASIGLDTKDFEHFNYLKNQGIPLILFDRFSNNVSADIVAIDHFKAAYEAVNHLIEQGCKKIAHIAGYQHVHIYKERLEGYKKALKDNNIPFNTKLVKESDLTIEHSHNVTEGMLEESPTLDGIFASGDYAAIGAVRELREAGRNVPEDVAVVGFSNETFTSMTSPTITTIEQNGRRMGELAFETFLESSRDDKAVKADVAVRKTIPFELKIRESSKRN